MILEVARTDIRSSRLVDRSTQELAPGHVRLAIERFALTANNVSYATAGDLLGYWDFFPTESGWGRVPAMSIVTVEESTHPEVQPGRRLFGFTPMAGEVVLEVEPHANGFRDVGEHRSAHANTYVGFTDVEHIAAFEEDTADQYLLLHGLFMTSFLIDDFLSENGDFGAAQTLVTSASSKTSIALAHLHRLRGRPSVGLTSRRNKAFVEGLELYADVLIYDDIEDLDSSVATSLVDMAGNGTVRSRVHEHFADRLAYSGLVGATHWDESDGGVGSLAGPAPAFFFAPSQIDRRNAEWGPDETQRRIAAAFGEFVSDSSRWLKVEHRRGPLQAQAAWGEVVEGAAAPNIGIVVSMA